MLPSRAERVNYIFSRKLITPGFSSGNISYAGVEGEAWKKRMKRKTIKDTTRYTFTCRSHDQGVYITKVVKIFNSVWTFKFKAQQTRTFIRFKFVFVDRHRCPLLDRQRMFGGQIKTGLKTGEATNTSISVS